jgi:hypothetical protein
VDDHDEDAEGWYKDPYQLHQQRWFSAGRPSALVRDGDVESTDAPPSESFDGPLVEVLNDPGANGNDLRRAGEGQGGSYDANRAWDAAVDASVWFPIT